MPKTILVALGGSDLAERALPYAVALARPTGGRLLLLHAVPAGSPGETGDPQPDAYAYLERLVERAREEGLEAASRVEYIYYWEEAARAINDVAAERQADLIVMASHGRGGLGRWLWGSVSDMVMRTAQKPVLLVPAAGESAWPADRPPRILVPLDGSSLAEQALGPAAALAESLPTELHLLRVIEVVDGVFPAYGGVVSVLPYDPAPELAEVQSYLEKTASGLRSAGRTVTVHMATGYPATTIAQVAREQGIGLIAMATHGRGGLARLLLGSVATDTIGHVSIPLLLLRPTPSVEQAAVPEPPAPPQRLPDIPRTPLPAGTAALAVSPRELDLLYRGLGELLYAPARDIRLVGPVRDLMAKLKDAAPVAAAGRPVSTQC